MKNSSILIPLVLAGIYLGTNAHATVLFQDGFNYNTGLLNPGNTGNVWSGGNNNLTVSSGNLTYSGLLDLGGNELSDAWGVSAGSAFSIYANTTSGSIYYSFLLDCTAAPSSTSGTYLTALNAGTTSPGGSGDALSLYVKNVSGNFEIGVRSGGSSQSYIATPLTVGTTYLVVMEYNFTTPQASLFLDPVAGGIQPTAGATVTPSTAPTAIDDIGFKAQSSGTSTGTFLIDNTMIGTTWGDVTPVPEPSVMALAGLGLAGFALIRQRRR